jgi:signal transduction histidine kinase
MDRLLQKLRIISEINQPGEYSRIEILPIVQEMEQSFSTSLRRVNLVINCADDVIFYSNKTLTEAKLFYLLENAIFFSTAKDQPRAVVEFCAHMDNNVVEFRLRDNGIGIDEKILPNIFDMFYVGHEGSRGNGLGLYIVDKAVQALKGTITTESEVNTYTQFVVKIPVALSMAEAIESQPDTVGAADKQNDPFT